MRYPTLEHILSLHSLIIEASGGSDGIRDRGALESALHQPKASFGGEDLYPTLAMKAATLAYSVVNNHPFIDGNKRAGHAAMESFLMLNGYEISTDVDEQEELFLGLAAGNVTQADLAEWIEIRMIELA